MRELSRRTEKIAIRRENLKKSRFGAENVKNRDLSRRMAKIAIPHIPRFPFVPGWRGYAAAAIWQNARFWGLRCCKIIVK